MGECFIYMSNTNLTEKWFETEIGRNIVVKKYLHDDEKDFFQFRNRVQSVFASNNLKDFMFESLYTADFFPGGRSLYALGCKGKFKASTSNCYILPMPEDDLWSINKVQAESEVIYSKGGGCGVNLSKLRPRGAKVNNAARTSTGAVSFINKFNVSAETIGAHGRRAALMVGLNCDHPDIEEFLTIKQNNTAIQAANLSILFTDDFMEAVKTNSPFKLYFKVESTGEEIEKWINAKDFFWKFAEAQFDYAEPGAIFISKMRKYHLLSGYSDDEYRIDITNPCSEYQGNAYNACNLGSFNLYNVVKQPFTKNAYVDEDLLKSVVANSICALDEILDYGYDLQPLNENRKCIDDWRAIGLGVMGLADMFIALGLRYGSVESLDTLDKVMRIVWNEAVLTSAMLAKEKGTFGKYDWNKVKKSPLMKLLDNDVYKVVETYGLRNASLLSVAPTGTIGTMAGLSGGVEPLFDIIYQRTTHSLSSEKKFFKVFAKSVEHLIKSHNIEIDVESSHAVDDIKKRFPFVVSTHDIDPIERVKLQATMQKYVDNAISSTVNMKHEATVQDVFDTYIAAWENGCKGITIFRNGCKRDAILKTTTEIKKENEKPETKEEKESFKFDSVIPFKAKEVDELDGKRFVKHTACVPSMYINITHKDGNIYEVFTNAGSGCHSNISTITRLASLAFRLGGKVKEVTKEMKANQCPACIVLKQKGDKSISNSCGSAIAEAVEKMYDILQQNPNAVFVPNNTAPTINKSTSTVEYMECPECHEQTLRPEAKCFNCSNCGYSRCE